MHRSHDMRRGAGSRIVLAAALLAMAAAPALAHHPMGGKTPSNFLEGFLSGIGHPVIGPDHLAFIVAIGIAAALVPAGLALIGAFFAASTAGVLIHVGKLNLPLSEQLVALSVIAAGALIALGHANRQPVWLALAAVAGLFHGYAFGEAVVGAERSVVGAYLVGIAIVTSIIAVGIMQFTRQVLGYASGTAAGSPHLRGAGIIVGCVGAVMLAGSLIAA